MVMGDVFLEQIVKQQKSFKEILRNVAIIIVGLLLAAGLFLLLLTPFRLKEYLGMFVFLILAGVVYYTWYIVSGLNLEFEYIFTNGEIDVDKISNKRKRKRITTVRVSQASSFGEFDYSAFDKSAYAHVYNASAFLKGQDNYILDYANRDGEKCCLIFTPDEKMLEAIKKYYHPRVHTI